MELGEARDAARRLIERADKGVPIEASGTASAIGRRAHARRAARPLRGAAHREGKRIKTLPKAMRSLRRTSQALSVAACRPVLEGRPARVRDAMVEAGTVIAANRLLGYLGPGRCAGRRRKI